MNASADNIKPAHLIIITIFLGCILFYGHFSVGHNWGGDFSAYIMQAISIVDGNIYEFINKNKFTIDESSYPMGPVAYPWGLPIILAAVYKLFGVDLLAFKMVMLFSYAAFLTVLYFGYKSVYSSWWLWLMIAIFAFNPWLLRFGDSIFSDIPFLFVSTSCVLVIDRVITNRRKLISAAIDRLLIGLILFSAFLIRTNGVLLVAVLAASQIFAVYQDREETRSTIDRASNKIFNRGIFNHAAVAAIPYVTFLIMASVVGLLFPTGGVSHLDHLGNVSLGSIAYNVAYNFSLPKSFFGGYAVYFATLPFVIVGIIRGYVRRNAEANFMFLTVALFVVWPYSSQGLRFLLPIMPFYIAFFISEIVFISKYRIIGFRYLKESFLFGLSLLLVIYFFSSSVVFVHENLENGRTVSEGPFTHLSTDMFDFIREHTASSEVILFRKPRVMRFLTNRESLAISSIDELTRPAIIVIDRNDARAKYQLDDSEMNFLRTQGSLDTLYTNRQFSVYRFTYSVTAP